MIFKVIIQNLQTSNTSASQNNNQKDHQKTFNIFEREQSSWGVVLSKTKKRDSDVILSPSFPQAIFSREGRFRGGFLFGFQSMRNLSNHDKDGSRNVRKTIGFMCKKATTLHVHHTFWHFFQATFYGGWRERTTTNFFLPRSLFLKIEAFFARNKQNKIWEDTNSAYLVKFFTAMVVLIALSSLIKLHQMHS